MLIALVMMSCSWFCIALYTSLKPFLLSAIDIQIELLNDSQNLKVAEFMRTFIKFIRRFLDLNIPAFLPFIALNLASLFFIDFEFDIFASKEFLAKIESHYDVESAEYQRFIGQWTNSTNNFLEIKSSGRGSLKLTSENAKTFLNNSRVIITESDIYFRASFLSKSFRVNNENEQVSLELDSLRFFKEDQAKQYNYHTERAVNWSEQCLNLLKVFSDSLDQQDPHLMTRHFTNQRSKDEFINNHQSFYDNKFDAKPFVTNFSLEELPIINDQLNNVSVKTSIEFDGKQLSLDCVFSTDGIEIVLETFSASLSLTKLTQDAVEKFSSMEDKEKFLVQSIRSKGDIGGHTTEETIRIIESFLHSISSLDIKLRITSLERFDAKFFNDDLDTEKKLLNKIRENYINNGFDQESVDNLMESFISSISHLDLEQRIKTLESIELSSRKHVDDW
jgi:hypothetical protein